MTTVEVAATLASAILIKATIVGLLPLVASRLARSASGATLTTGIGSAALILIGLLEVIIPARGSGYLSISHAAVARVSVGSIVLEPAQVLVAIWAAGAVVLLAVFARDVSIARSLASRAADGDRRAGILLQRAGVAVGLHQSPHTAGDVRARNRGAHRLPAPGTPHSRPGGRVVGRTGSSECSATSSSTSGVTIG